MFHSFSSEDGNIYIFKDGNKNPMKILREETKATSLPVTCVRWMERENDENSKNLLASSDTNGNLKIWHSTSGKLLTKTEEYDNEIYCLDYSPSQHRIVSGGKDTNVRIYDPNKLKTAVSVLTESSFIPQHSNRVFSVKFAENDTNLLLSAGWDHCLLIWDLRVNTPVEYIYGPSIFGDSLDFHSNMILAGSWRDKNQIELYDIRNYKKVAHYDWIIEEENVDSPPYIYACKFVSNGTKIVAGTTGINEVRVFDYQKNFKCKHLKSNMNSGIFCIEELEKEYNYLICGTEGMAIHLEPKLL